MNNNETRMVATFLVWLAFTVIMIAALVTGALTGPGASSLVGFAILVTAVAIATHSIWKYGGDKGWQIEASEKSKRRSRVDRVLQGMDDAELDELRARLAGESDGESVSLEELLAERERRHR